MQEQRPPTKRAWGPRISLFSTLLLMTIAGMTIVIVQFWREIGPLRREVRLLRDQVGVLTIEDESKLHAIRVLSDADFTWKWRVWIPNGKPRAVYWMWGDVSKDGVPRRSSWAPLNPGEEQLLTLTAKRLDDGKSWVSHLRTARQVSTLSVPDAAFAVPNSATLRGVERMTEIAANDGQPFVLGRYRVAAESQKKLLEKDVPLPGFLIWIEQE